MPRSLWYCAVNGSLFWFFCDISFAFYCQRERERESLQCCGPQAHSQDLCRANPSRVFSLTPVGKAALPGSKRPAAVEGTNLLSLLWLKPAASLSQSHKPLHYHNFENVGQGKEVSQQAEKAEMHVFISLLSPWSFWI